MPPGLSDRASDPVVAYSAKHGVWLISGLAIQNGIATRLTMHRSRDGFAWSGPVDAAISQTAELAYDKQWLTCDNGTSSPYRGRCYLAYTDLQASGEVFALQRSDDGGLTWSPPVTSPIYLTGVIPVVQPTGRLVISSWAQAAQTIVAITSNDGGVTLGAPVQISDLRTRSAQPFRAPPLVAAELDRGGGILVTWQDCRFRAGVHGERRRAHPLGRRRHVVGAAARHVRAERRHADDRRRPGNRAAGDPLLHPLPDRGRRRARDVGGRGALVGPAAAERAADVVRLDAPDDTRPDARRLHRRHVVARPPRGGVRACLPAAERRARTAIYATDR